MTQRNYASVFELFKELFRHVSSKRRRQFVLLLLLTGLSSFAEIISLGSVLPFIGILTDPDRVFSSPAMAGVVNSLGITSGAELVLPLTIAFAVAAILAGALRLVLLWISIRLGNATGADLGIQIYTRTLYQPYSVHVARSSSEIIAGITQKVGTATSVLISGVAVITSSILFAAILVTLFSVDPVVASFAFSTFGLAYWLVAKISRQRLVQNSQCIAIEQTQVVKSLQEGLGAIRDVLLDGTQKVYSGIYRKSILGLQRASGENSFINQAPRFAMEALGMVLISLFVLVLSRRSGGVTGALPVLAMLALGAQRLLPLMQQLFGNWSVLAGSQAALIDVLALLEQPLPTDASQDRAKALNFNHSIVLDNLSFRYDNSSSLVLNQLNLEIPKGSRIGFIGDTGSGKSTVLDLLMGLLSPTTGQILVDGNKIDDGNRCAWQRSVAHVPQSIFLTDASILENIAFGIPADLIDHKRVHRAAEQAKLADYIESSEEGYNTIVGERGVRLSGGQRQRIGIARALYKQVNVLVLDEATSALDSATEQAVMESIDELSGELTVIIVAHRISTLKNCTQIIELSNGSVESIGKYHDLLSRQLQ